MLDYNIEPFFESVYQIRKETPHRRLAFLSNWDIDIASETFNDQLLKDVFKNALGSAKDYKFAYEQFDIKRQIVDFLQSHYAIGFELENIALSPGATQSIALVAKALKLLDRRRVLLFTPAYFSSYYSLQENNLFMCFYHLKDANNYKIDFDELRIMIQEQCIDVIFLTDPVYASGIEISSDDYKALIEVCLENNVLLAVDYSLGGLSWESSTDAIICQAKMALLKELPEFVLVDTITKRLSLNALKFSVIFGSEAVIDKIDLTAESTYGGLSSIQCELMKELYSNRGISYIHARHQEITSKVKENKRIIESLLLKTDLAFSPGANSGYFTLIDHSYYILTDMDTEYFSLCLLNENNTIAVTKDKFSYYKSNRFGFRVNLCQDKAELLFGITQCIGVDYERFKKRK